MNLITIHNVRGYIDENGTAQLNIEDVSRGLGFVQSKGKVTYVRWERVNGYLSDMGFPQLVGKEYIPENVFYRLSMKGETESALAFQAKVADEILPSIRKTGTYSINIPKSLPEALRAYAAEVEKNQILMLENQELKVKTRYVELILKSKATVTITQIAKDYGMSGAQLNKLLHEEKVQYKQNKQWLLYQKYHDRGYTKSETIDITRSNGDPDVTMNTRWTQKGRLFIHEILTKRGIVPFMDRETVRNHG
ncbi:phage antirepressor KilAC domain-containing protein [Paenibacillus sp. GYB003]|uniref:phage antirepressor KilAC domain-containing protein n=1 Tax=Paenibacillus sp. GYB003 TaxID=2994392 RepID=UPI002F966CA5